MCVIMTKPMGVSTPEEKVFKAMFVSNSDGAGYMYAKNKRVYIRKGFMTFEDFWSDYLDNKDDSLAFVFHFRIGTSGGNIADNTHPFPVEHSEGALKALRYTTDLGVCHNGIITCDIDRGLSDTMTYIKNTLHPMYKIDKKFYDNKWFNKIIYDQTTSKWAFLNKDGEIITIGTFSEHQEAPGCHFSNLSFGWRINQDFDLTTKYPYYKSYGYYSSPSVMDYNGTYKENSNKYMQTRVMWCDEDKDTAYNPATGQLYIGYFGLDACGDVVTYDADMNCIVHFTNLVMVGPNGERISYGDVNDARVYSWESDYDMEEDIDAYISGNADSYGSLVYKYDIVEEINVSEENEAEAKVIQGQCSLID